MAQQQRYPVSVCSIFVCPKSGMVANLGIFNVRTDAGACDCMDTVRESALEADFGRKNPLPHRGLEPASGSRIT